MSQKIVKNVADILQAFYSNLVRVIPSVLPASKATVTLGNKSIDFDFYVPVTSRPITISEEIEKALDRISGELADFTGMNVHMTVYADHIRIILGGMPLHKVTTLIPRQDKETTPCSCTDISS